MIPFIQSELLCEMKSGTQQMVFLMKLKSYDATDEAILMRLKVT